ncbi:MAG: alcohol dehydrogenase catalytic domain-containing protein [Bifidobacteriaceae bacterium]|nr:alcohol dehydrogenase catalytic domain-containing protein [Bifidobacteriaceae bacterium]
MEVVDSPEQSLGPGRVRARLAHSGICGSDPHVAEGAFAAHTPQGLGHEVSGVIEELGTDLTSHCPSGETSRMQLPSFLRRLLLAQDGKTKVLRCGRRRQKRRHGRVHDLAPGPIVPTPRISQLAPWLPLGTRVRPSAHGGQAPPEDRRSGLGLWRRPDRTERDTVTGPSRGRFCRPGGASHLLSIGASDCVSGRALSMDGGFTAVIQRWIQAARRLTTPERSAILA